MIIQNYEIAQTHISYDIAQIYISSKRASATCLIFSDLYILQQTEQMRAAASASPCASRTC